MKEDNSNIEEVRKWLTLGDQCDYYNEFKSLIDMIDRLEIENLQLKNSNCRMIDILIQDGYILNDHTTNRG